MRRLLIAIVGLVLGGSTLAGCGTSSGSLANAPADPCPTSCPAGTHCEPTGIAGMCVADPPNR